MLLLNVAPLALSGFPDLPQWTVNAVDRIVIGNWQSCDGAIGFWALARQTAKQIPLASIRVSSHNAKVRTRADVVMRDTRRMRMTSPERTSTVWPCSPPSRSFAQPSYTPSASCDVL